MEENFTLNLFEKAKLKEYERIIKEVTEKCKVTHFPTEDGKTYPYVWLPYENRVPPDFSNAVKVGMTIMLKDLLKLSNVALFSEAKAFLLAGVASENGLHMFLLEREIPIYQTK